MGDGVAVWAERDKILRWVDDCPGFEYGNRSSVVHFDIALCRVPVPIAEIQSTRAALAAPDGNGRGSIAAVPFVASRLASGGAAFRIADRWRLFFRFC